MTGMEAGVGTIMVEATDTVAAGIWGMVVKVLGTTEALKGEGDLAEVLAVITIGTTAGSRALLTSKVCAL